MAVGVDQHFAAADMVGDADQPVLFHPLDQPRRTVVTDAQLALDIAGRGLLALGDDLDRLAVKLGLGVVLLRRLAVEQIAAVLGLLGNRLNIIGDPLLAPVIGDRADLVIADKRAVDAQDLLDRKSVV